jgi:antitoxin component of MazEF toxin-antitoxin module
MQLLASWVGLLVYHSLQDWPMHALKLSRIGSQLAIVLPPEILGQYGLKEGDTLYLSGAPGAAVLAAAADTPFSADPASVEQLQAGQEFMRDFHAAFRALAR